jgi:hypothetical protein
MNVKSMPVLAALAALLSVAVLEAPNAQAYPTGAKQVAASSSDPDTDDEPAELILDYRVVRTCPVSPNYPQGGVIGNDIGWSITSSDIVGWRYNVNDIGNVDDPHTWAMISHKKYRNNNEDPRHPWWGFVQRSCIGGSVGGEHFPTPTSSYPSGQPVPKRLLQGRSNSNEAVGHYRRVDFSPVPDHVINDHKKVNSMGTLRDGAHFVIGNVLPGWHVHTTERREAGWIKVYVPNAKRWGWIRESHF